MPTALDTMPRERKQGLWSFKDLKKSSNNINSTSHKTTTEDTSTKHHHKLMAHAKKGLLENYYKPNLLEMKVTDCVRTVRCVKTVKVLEDIKT